MKITFLCPHLRIAGGVRAILTHADRLARRGHEVTLLVPAKGGLAASKRACGGCPSGARPACPTATW